MWKRIVAAIGVGMIPVMVKYPVAWWYVLVMLVVVGIIDRGFGKYMLGTGVAAGMLILVIYGWGEGRLVLMENRAVLVVLYTWYVAGIIVLVANSFTYTEKLRWLTHMGRGWQWMVMWDWATRVFYKIKLVHRVWRRIPLWFYRVPRVMEQLAYMMAKELERGEVRLLILKWRTEDEQT